jgi:non-homologous end joining protein Ku
MLTASRLRICDDNAVVDILMIANLVGGRLAVRKLIAFDDDTFDKLKQLARDRMATLQELADEAFADLLKKHGIPIDLKDALRKSAAVSSEPTRRSARKTPPRKSR